MIDQVLCRLDTFVQFVSALLKILQTTWIISMAKNVCNILIHAHSALSFVPFCGCYLIITFIAVDQRALGMSMRVERASLEQVS